MMPRTGCGPLSVKLRRFGVNAGRVNDTSAELDDARRTAGNGAAFDLAVGGVEHLGRRHPLRTEGKDVFVGVRDVSITDHQAAAATGDRVERNRGSIGRERGSGDSAIRRGHQALGAARTGRCAVDGVYTRLFPPIRDERDLGRSVSPTRVEFVRRRRRDLLDVAGRERQHPDVVAAAAIRRECDALAVGRP
jgi:hypothetical protein